MANCPLSLELLFGQTATTISRKKMNRRRVDRQRKQIRWVRKIGDEPLVRKEPAKYKDITEKYQKEHNEERILITIDPSRLVLTALICCGE